MELPSTHTYISYTPYAALPPIKNEMKSTTPTLVFIVKERQTRGALVRLIYNIYTMLGFMPTICVSTEDRTMSPQRLCVLYSACQKGVP